MTIKDQSLQDIIKRAIAGEQSALKSLFDRFGDAMYNICLRMTGNKQDAEDIVQESFIKAFRNLKQLTDQTSFPGWLRTIVVNNCLQHYKKKVLFLELDNQALELEDEDESWISRFSVPEIHQKIKELPEGCRQIFLLYASENFTHREIAKQLNISESTSKSQYQRAKKLLKQQLKNNE